MSPTKDRLLNAAGTVVRRDGPRALTLDAVAAEAGVSKGGLLYHYGTKQELIEALVARWLGDFQHDIDAGHPHLVRGYVRAWAPAGEVADELALLAALVADPAVLR